MRTSTRDRRGWPRWTVPASLAAFIAGSVIVASTDPASAHPGGAADAGATLILLAVPAFAVAASAMLWRWWRARRGPVPSRAAPRSGGLKRAQAAPADSGQCAGGGLGFAVVDLETTGLHPATDRVVEVAVVHLDANAEITGQFCTLIDPRRDVGPTRLHGITAAAVQGAPTFDYVHDAARQQLPA